MIDQEANHERRANDAASLLVVNTLTLRMAYFIDRFDKFVVMQNDAHKVITVMLVKHEELVIKTITSWKWFTTLTGIIGSLMLSIGLYFYQELTVLKDSVLVHHTKDIQREQRQNDINEEIERKLKELGGH